jgi:IS5 family transposase
VYRVSKQKYIQVKKHDFKLFKESKLAIKQEKEVLLDRGYQGIDKVHAKSKIPKKKQKGKPLTKEERKHNRNIAKQRVENENVIGMLKRFKIIADKYRNRRKRFGLRFNLIAGLYNYELLN